jgi:CheY-like chemotaxis protein
MPLTILYAEDNEVIRLAVEETLGREGRRMETCADDLIGADEEALAEIVRAEFDETVKDVR